MKPYLLAAIAIVLWSSLAAIAVYLREVPPLLLSGLALIIGSLPSWHRIVDWRLPWRTLMLGIYGLLGYHLLLFLAFRNAPAVEVNLLNYLWPIFIILLSPVMIPHLVLRPAHIVAGLMGFLGAALAMLSGQSLGFDREALWGFWAAIGAAFVWATYSLGCKKIKYFPTTAIGLFALVSGCLALFAHGIWESSYTPNFQEWTWIVLMGLGPLGCAFYAWDYAIKHADPRRVAVMSFATPILSTLILLVMMDRPITWQIIVAVGLLVGAGYIGGRAK